jgi:hypothetical protein
MAILSANSTMKPIGESYIMANNQSTIATNVNNPDFLEDRKKAQSSTWDDFTKRYYEAKNREGEYKDENADRLSISSELEKALDQSKKESEVKEKLDRGDSVPADLRKDVNVAKIKNQLDNINLEKATQTSTQSEYTLQQALQQKSSETKES